VVHELVRAVPDVATGTPQRLPVRREGSGAEVAFATTVDNLALLSRRHHRLSKVAPRSQARPGPAA
jgi:hypothetical protein